MESTRGSPEPNAIGAGASKSHSTDFEHTYPKQEFQRSWLSAEWVAAAEAGWSDPHLDAWMQAQGVPGPSKISAFGYPAGLSVYGLASVETEANGLYHPHASGRPAIIMPTCLYGPELEPEDMIAWRSNEPSRVWRRAGAASILDPWSVDRATWASLDEPLTVHETPLAWLQSGCRGTVILDWTARLFLTFSGVREIVADLPVERASELQRLIRPAAYETASISLPSSRLEAA